MIIGASEVYDKELVTETKIASYWAPPQKLVSSYLWMLKHRLTNFSKAVIEDIFFKRLKYAMLMTDVHSNHSKRIALRTGAIKR